MSAALAKKPTFEFHLRVTSGQDKGAIYKLMSPEVTLGRGADCDIPLTDPKCSRKHAIVRFTNNQFTIHWLSEKNKLFVNNVEVTQPTVLHPNAVIRIGDTEIQFEVKAPSSAATLPPEQQQSPAPLYPSNNNTLIHHHHPASNVLPMPHRERHSHSTSPPKTPASSTLNIKNQRRLVIYGVIGLLLWWLLSPSSSKKEEVALRTNIDVEADIETARQLQIAAQEQRGQNASQLSAHEEAQAAYVRGFRDYRKGQFGRAMESFQACLSLNPQHALCTRYLRLSQRRHNELVQHHMILGRTYRDQNQFAACQSAFRNVMVMVRDPSSQVYEEAKANHDACGAFLKGRF